MRIRLSISILSAAIPSLQGHLVLDKLAAEEIPQCYVETEPCGTPEHLYNLISNCLKEPDLCRSAKQRPGIVADSDGTNVSPAAIGGSGAPVSAAPLRRNAETSSQPLRPTNGHVPILSRPAAAPVYNIGVTEEAGSDKADSQSRIVTEVARDLPLDSAVRNLRDTMPTDAATIERRLGLRRTRVAGFDLRSKVPSPDEIVLALSPRDGVRQ